MHLEIFYLILFIFLATSRVIILADIFKIINYITNVNYLYNIIEYYINNNNHLICKCYYNSFYMNVTGLFNLWRPIDEEWIQ